MQYSPGPGRFFTKEGQYDADPKRRGWEIPERLATPEDVYLNRRESLRSMGSVGVGERPRRTR